MRLIGLSVLVLSMLSASSVALAQTGPVYRTGRGVTVPEVLKEIRPRHTPASMERRIEGSVMMDVVVEADGTVGEGKVTKSLDVESGLDQQAIDAMKQWEFKPGTYEGKPVAVEITVELSYRLR